MSTNFLIRLLMATPLWAGAAGLMAQQQPAVEPLPKAPPPQIIPVPSEPLVRPSPAEVGSAPQKSAPAAAQSSSATAKPAEPGKAAAQAASKKPAQPAGDQTDAIRSAIREKMQGQGELILRASDGSAVSPSAAPKASGQTASSAGAQNQAAVPAPAKPEAEAGAAPAVTPPAAVIAPSGWGYEGERGPLYWSKLSPAFALCEKGRFQSPIDLRDGVAVDLPALNFDFRSSLFKLTDTGRTLEVQYLSGGTFTVMGNPHRLTHIVFRYPAEERINGRSFDMGMQMHYRDAAGKPAIVSVVFNVGARENPFIQTLWNHIPLMRNEAVAPPDATIDLNQALPERQGYFNYLGSLTTPPCTEGIMWYVLKTPMEISVEQLGIFRRLYPNNARPIQQSNNRLIKESRQK